MYTKEIKQIVKEITTTLPKSNCWTDNRFLFQKYGKQIKQATSFLTEASYSERIYCIQHNITKRPKCKMCNLNNVPFRYAIGYGKYCSHKCSNDDGAGRYKEVQKTNLKKYGVDNPFKVKSIQKECQKTNPFKTEEGQQKAKDGLIKKYGKNFREKLLAKGCKTNLKKYGYENAAKNESVKQKMLKNRFGTKLACNIGKNEKELLDKQEKIDNCIINRDTVIGLYRLDGYCKETNTVYEVYEKFHRWKKHKIRDKQRQQYIEEKLNCNFVVIWDL